MRTATIYNFLLEANLMAAIAIVLMIPVRKFLRKPLGNRVIYFAWLLVAIRLLCPLALPNPAINSIRSVFSQDQAIRPIAGQVQVRFSDAAWDVYRWIGDRAASDSSIVASARSFAQSTFNGTLSLRLMQWYLLGVGLMVLWFVFANVRFRRRLRADRIEPISGELLADYRAMCARRGVKPLPVYFTDPLPSACLVGVFKPYIALPLTAAPKDAVSVLTHEICHYQGRDHLWGLLRLLCCAVHWFNPLVWVAAHMSRIDGELACDDRVIRKLGPGEKLAYANILVLSASRRNAPGVSVLATGMTMTGRNLKTRVNAILHNGSVKKGFALAFAIVASMALIGAFATAEYGDTNAVPASTWSDSGQPVANFTTEAKVIDYAKQIWGYDWLEWAGTDDLSWESVFNEGQYYVSATGDDPNASLAIHFTETGEVTYLFNGLSHFADSLPGTALYAEDSSARDQLAQDLLNFVETVNPGTSDAIEAFHYVDETDYGDQHFVTFLGYTYSADGSEDDTYSLFIMQVSPEMRVISFETGIPQSNIGQGVG